MNLTCANTNCSAELKYLRGGRLYLMERRPQASEIQPFVTGDHKSSTPSSRTADAPPGAGVVMRRYFWLCESCAEKYVIRRWTDSGLEIVPRHLRKTVQRVPMPSREWFLPGLVG